MTRLLSILLLLAVFACGDDPTDPRKPAQPAIPVIIGIPDKHRPYLDDSTYVQVLIDSDAELDSVVATVGPLRATLADAFRGERAWFRHGAIHGGGALDLGRHELVVTAFGSEGGLGADTFTLLREPKPAIEVVSPRGPYEVLGHRPRIAATCTDPVRGDCASLELRAGSPGSWPLMARSDGAIDTVMDWNAVLQDDGYVTFRLVGSTVGGREAEAWFNALVAPTDGLVGVDSVVGLITDADSGRILSRQWCGRAFSPWECDGPRLRIKNRSTGAVVVSPVLPTSGRAGTSRAVLTSTGAMTGKPTGIDFHDSRIETLGSADAIRVSGPYAVFTDAGRILLRDHRSAPGQPAWSRELSTGADRYAFQVDVGSSGTVVFTAEVGRPVVRWQDGGLDTLAVSGHAVALGDAFIAYTRPTGDVWEDDYEVVVLAAGVEEVVGLLPGRYHQLEAAGEWLLFVAKPTAEKNDDGDWTSVPGQAWIRSPDGRVVELPATASHVVDLAEDGRVLFKYAWETDPYGLHLFDPTTGRTTLVAKYYDAAGFADSDVWVSLGRHLFRPQ